MYVKTIRKTSLLASKLIHSSHPLLSGARWYQLHYTSSHLIQGPERMYGSKGLYGKAFYGFLAGALIPIPFYLLSRWKFPEMRHIYTPILLSGGMLWAPLNLSWLIPSLYLGYIFQVYVKRKHFDWWANYNVRTFSVTLITLTVSNL